MPLPRSWASYLGEIFLLAVIARQTSFARSVLNKIEFFVPAVVHAGRLLPPSLATCNGVCCRLGGLLVCRVGALPLGWGYWSGRGVAESLRDRTCATPAHPLHISSNFVFVSILKLSWSLLCLSLDWPTAETNSGSRSPLFVFSCTVYFLVQ